MRQLGRYGRRLVGGAAVALALAATVALGGCANSSEQVQELIEQGIAADVAELTALSSESAAELFASDYTSQLQAAGVDPVAVYGPMFADLACRVDSVTVDGDRATVRLAVTNKDLTAALQAYTATITNELATPAGRDALAALDDAALTRHMAEVLADCLNDASVATASKTVELAYVKDGSTWKLQDGTALAGALLGNLDANAAANPTQAQMDAAAATAQANIASLVPPAVDPAAAGEAPVEGADPAAEGADQAV